jgi:signal transduction histidine kinase
MADARVATGARLAILVAGALCLAWGIAAVVMVESGADGVTTYAAASAAARAVDAAAGFGLLAAGVLACAQPRTRRLGMLALLAGTAWFGADWEGAEGASALLRTVGMVVAPFLLPLVLHLALAFPGGRARSRRERGVIVAAYGVAAAASVGRALFRDPLLDLYCWRNCADNSFLVHADPGLASTLGDAWLWSALAIATVLIVAASRRLVTASRPARRAVLPLLGPAILVGAAEAAYVVVLLDDPLEDPNRGVFAAVFIARAVSLAALAIGIAWCALSATRTRSRVARLASELGEAPAPGRLREALVAALGDPDLEVLYPHGGPEGLIDADGRRAAPAVDGRAVARITREGRTRALVVHDAALVDEPVLERELGASARLAVENEALRAEALAQLAELKASRARIVETGDAARRRLERNLHDGAQQQLLALSYDLRLALAEARAHHDEARAAVLDAAAGETAIALQELRDLAHGIHPAILTEAGLGPALATLADEAPLPVELGDVELRRYPPAVETTAYAVAVETIEDAARRGATFLAVRVQQRGNRLAIDADDDGEARTSPLLHLADRVGALGGSLDCTPPGLRVELPCG